MDYKPGFYWVLRTEDDTLEVAYINVKRMGITIVDQHLVDIREWFWIGDRIEEPYKT